MLLSRLRELYEVFFGLLDLALWIYKSGWWMKRPLVASLQADKKRVGNMVQAKTVHASSVIYIINVLCLVPAESLNWARDRMCTQWTFPMILDSQSCFFITVLEVNSPLPFICLSFQRCPKCLVCLELVPAPVTKYFTCTERKKKEARLSRKRQMCTIRAVAV